MPSTIPAQFPYHGFLIGQLCFMLMEQESSLNGQIWGVSLEATKTYKNIANSNEDQQIYKADIWLKSREIALKDSCKASTPLNPELIRAWNNLPASYPCWDDAINGCKPFVDFMTSTS